MMPEASAYDGWPESAGAGNVKRVHERVFNDINNGTHTAPPFQDAVVLHELLDALEQSARV